MTAIPLIHPVILCGGSGTRLWPLSRKSYPKQFSRLLGEDSLFQACARRTRAPGFADPVIVTGDPFRFIVAEQLAAIEMGAQSILIEPEGRNTAPAVLSAALHLSLTDPDALMLVVPSDHVIPDAGAFRKAIAAAADTARAHRLVTFGITPTRPETGFGYLELAQGTSSTAETPQPLTRFVEKPDLARAEKMVSAGNFLWNAGVFLFSVHAVLEAFRTHAPAVTAAVEQAVAGARTDLGFTRLAPDPWRAAENISIDYAIMEKTADLAVMPFGAGWSDLGSWEAVWQECGPDAEGNVVSHHATAIDCRGTLLRSEAEGLELVGIGLEDMIAIAMSDAVLVARRDDSQRVKDAVAALKARGAAQAEAFPREHRPWGWFETLVRNDRFQLRKIVLQPGTTLGLQSHAQRSETWIVVEGRAAITIDDSQSELMPGQSAHIPAGAVHRLANPADIALVLIEVRIGAYLGDDDVTRYPEVAPT